MIILIAYLGGLFTIINPCILPIVPFVLVRASQSFRSSGLPILIGMALTFTLVASVAVVSSEWIAQANQIGRWVALSLLGVFSLSLLFPAMNVWLMRPFVSAGNRINNSVQAKSGFASSVFIGIATGLLWAPCAGPILGLIMSGAILQGANANTSLLLFAYAAGAATSLGAILLISKPLFKKLKSGLPYINGLRRGLGAFMLTSVAAIAAGFDTSFLAQISSGSTTMVEQTILNRLSVNPITAGIPTIKLAQKEAPKLRLSNKGTMPPISGAVEWLNSEPLSNEQLLGKVVVIKFWTYSCINCIRSLPYAIELDKKFRDQGLVVIGVHTPEFAFEKNLNNIRKAVKRFQIDFPVAVDSNYTIWRAFSNRYWPALYVIDAKGQIRHTKFGEGGYAYTEQVVQQLLADAGADNIDSTISTFEPSGVHVAANVSQLKSGETYIGYSRASGVASSPRFKANQAQIYSTPQRLSLNNWGLSGNWQVGAEFAVAKEPGATITMRFQARDVNLVLGTETPDQAVRFKVRIDGKAPGESHGVDVNAQGEGVVTDNKLYQLIRQQDTARPMTFEIEFLDIDAQAYVFSFG